MVTVELGGHITLSGFSERDFTELIIIKKMVGQYARKLTDTVPGFEKVSIELRHTSPKFSIASIVTVNGKEHVGEASGSNIFIALDNSLKQVTEKLH